MNDEDVIKSQELIILKADFTNENELYNYEKQTKRWLEWTSKREREIKTYRIKTII